MLSEVAAQRMTVLMRFELPTFDASRNKQIGVASAVEVFKVKYFM